MIDTGNPYSDVCENVKAVLVAAQASIGQKSTQVVHGAFKDADYPAIYVMLAPQDEQYMPESDLTGGEFGVDIHVVLGKAGPKVAFDQIHALVGAIRKVLVEESRDEGGYPSSPNGWGDGLLSIRFDPGTIQEYVQSSSLIAAVLEVTYARTSRDFNAG